MADERKSGECLVCQRRVVVFRKIANHLLHLVLSLFTAGFWVLIWLLAAMSPGPWRCAACGSPRISKVQ